MTIDGVRWSVGYIESFYYSDYYILATINYINYMLPRVPVATVRVDSITITILVHRNTDWPILHATYK